MCRCSQEILAVRSFRRGLRLFICFRRGLRLSVSVRRNLRLFTVVQRDSQSVIGRRICGQVLRKEKRQNMDILSLSAVELGTAIREGRATAVEAMQAVLGRIEESEEAFHCYITIDKERALEQAGQVQKRIETGELTGPLAGVPVAIKDSFRFTGVTIICRF